MAEFMKKKNFIAFLLSALGTAFLIYYIFRASLDVVASDYIRIINYYLPDVTDLHYLLSWEGISRVPFTFLARFVNVKFLHYSVFFDKILGTFGLFIFNFVTVKFVLNTLKNDYTKIITSIVITFISFSLMSWEMILNGTGYPHFLTIGFIAFIFYLYDRIVKRTKIIMTYENLDSSDLKYYANKDENNRLSNMVALIDTSQMQRRNLRAHALVYMVTAATSLLFAGSYAVAFLCTIIFFSIIEIFVFIAIRDKYNRGEITQLSGDKKLYAGFKEQYNSQEIRAFGKNKGEKYSTVNNESTFKIFVKFLLLILISVICLLCYFKSNNTGEALPVVGAKDITLLELLRDDPRFPLRFFLKSLASAIIGTETFSYAITFGTIDESVIFIFGFIYVFILIVTLIVLIIRIANKNASKNNIFDIDSYRSIFPFMYIVIGFANFALIFLARYKFVRDEYGMSSRYGIQYMFLTIGIIIILMMFIDDNIINGKFYIKDIRGKNLSKSYMKKREKLIAEGKIKIAEPKISKRYVFISVFVILSVFILFTGHLTTSTDEIFKADYRKISYENLIKCAKSPWLLTDDQLMTAFEYHRDADHIRNALDILRDNQLNVFYNRK